MDEPFTLRKMTGIFTIQKILENRQNVNTRRVEEGKSLGQEKRGRKHY